jgi:hypothetical protein
MGEASIRADAERIHDLIFGVNGKAERSDLVRLKAQLIIEEVFGPTEDFD